MTNKEKIKQMTFSEKAMLLTGKNMLTTASLDRLDVPSIEMADGPHGVRTASGKPCSVEGGVYASLPCLQAIKPPLRICNHFIVLN